MITIEITFCHRVHRVREHRVREHRVHRETYAKKGLLSVFSVNSVVKGSVAKGFLQ
jgi:hypothetical protein